MIQTESNSLPLQLRVGQLIAVGFHGTTLDHDSVKRIAEQAKAGTIGGVVIYRYNIESRLQLESLLRELRTIDTPFPLFVFVDQEGGRVQRINSSNGFSDTLSAREIANSLSLEEACRHYEELGRQLQETGFNFDFAPCVDIDCEPSSPAIGQLGRSYSIDPLVVANYAQCMIDALRNQGVLACLKHFPGHGRATGDSHTGLIDITDTWNEDEIEPYKELVRRGAVDAIMTSHLIHNQIDPGVPVTFSKEWCRKLRDEVKFEGVIVADDLHMGAMIQNYSLEDTVLQGLNAGLNILLFSNNPLAAKAQGIRHDLHSTIDSIASNSWAIPDPDLPEKIFEIVKLAISDGRLNESVINVAFKKVHALKEELQRLCKEI